MASRNEIKEVEGIVLRTVDYKEKDLIVDILAEKGRISFLARGAKSLTSKNASSLGILTKAKYALSTSSSGKMALKESVPIQVMGAKEDFSSLFALNFIAETANAFTASDLDYPSKTYDFLGATLEKINAGYDPLSGSLILLAHLLKANGSSLDVGECVRCHSKKNIVGISYPEGGFVCKDHAKKEDKILPSYALKVIRYCFLAGPKDIGAVAFEKDTAARLLRDLACFASDQFGIRFKSIRLLEAL